MQRDVERIYQIYRDYNRRKGADLLQYFSPEAEVIQSEELPWGGRYHGHDGLREFLGRVQDYLDSRVELEQVIDAGTQIVAVGKTLGKARRTNLGFDIPLVHVWAFESGLVTRFEAYIDNATMLAALGS